MSAPSAVRRGPRQRRCAACVPVASAATASSTFDRSLRNASSSASSCSDAGSIVGEGDHDHRVEFLAEPGSVGLEVRDHSRIEELALVAFERSASLDEHGSKAAGAFAELLDAHETVAHVALASSRQLRLDGHHLGVERGERGLQLGLCRRAVEARRRQRLELGPPRCDLTTGDVRLHLGQLA